MIKKNLLCSLLSFCTSFKSIFWLVRRVAYMPSIIYTDYYLPEKFLSVKEVMENSPELILPDNISLDSFCREYIEQSGLDKITVGDREKSIEVFKSLLTKFFETTDILPEEIAYVFFTDPDNSIHSINVNIASYLREEFKFSKATVFYLKQGCAGCLSAMGILNNLLNKNCKYGLILSSSFAPSIQKRYQKYSIWGDAQGIAVLSYESRVNEIADWYSLSDGSTSYINYNNIQIDKNSDSRIVLIRKGVDVIKHLLERNSLSTQDLAIMLPPITHYTVYSSVWAGLLGMPRDKIFLDNISNGGHTGDVDIIRNIKDSFTKFNFIEDSYVLLFSIGIENIDTSYQTILLKVK